MKLLRSAIIISMAICAFDGALAWADYKFTAIDIGDVGSEVTWGYDINNNGEIVGRSYNGPGYNQRAFYWKEGTIGVIHGLEEIEANASGINDRGQITGSYNYWHPYIWENGVVTGMEAAGYGRKINNAGQAVGGMVKDVYYWHTYIWQGEVITDLGTGEATAINESGTMVVGATVNHPINAAIWSNGVRTDLGLGTARAVNDKEQVVGQVNGSPFLWQDGTITYLATSGWAEGINENGQVVGYVGTESSSYPALWENGQLLDLRPYLNVDPFYTATYFEAMGINDRGDIIVYKEGRTIFLHNDNYVVPEPATMLLFSLGGLAFGIVRRKKPL